MKNAFGRRNFIKNSSLLGGSMLLFNLAPHSCFANGIKARDLNDIEKALVDQISQNDILVDDYLPGETLIQTYEFSIGTGSDFPTGSGKDITILCNHLIINGNFQNTGKNITVFCNTLTCLNSAIIDLSGNHADDVNVPQLSSCNGDSPNGTNADNIDPAGNNYQLTGQKGGICELYFSKIDGQLQILANGGNGAKGEDGGGACNGRDGREGGHDGVGESGVPAGTNGIGANGGNGGDGGQITIESVVRITQQGLNTNFFSQEDEQTTYSYPEGKISCSVLMGNGGIGGKGGNVIAHGGRGGLGGLIGHVRHRGGGRGGDREEYTTYGPDRAANGADYSNITSLPGDNGASGIHGRSGTLIQGNKYQAFISKLPSSFLRIQILKGEYYYLNSQYKSAGDIFAWLLSLYKYLENSPVTTTDAQLISSYLEQEPSSFSNTHYYAANLYLNQINMGCDFFGNNSNYVTLLDSEFINDKIVGLQSFFTQFEDLMNTLVKQNISYLQARGKLVQQQAANSNKIDKLKDEIGEQNKFIFDLNDDIMMRQNQLSILKQSILDKESAFRRAVENASSGCNVLNMFSAMASIVSVVAGVASGVGAVGAFYAVTNDAAKLKNNFIGNVDTIGPWINPVKWKDVFTSGGDHSLVKQVDTLKSDFGSFNDNVKAFKENLSNHPNNNDNLLAVSYDLDHPGIQSKDKFNDQIKGYIEQKNDDGSPKFPEAKIYEDEVFAYIDFCDLLNQKRVDFTNRFLSILSLKNQIDQLKIDNDLITHALLNVDSTKVSSALKTVVLDSYYKSLQFALKLVYLQKKAIDYFTLEPSGFNVQFYSLGIKGTYDNYLNVNQQKLISYLNNTGSPRQRLTTPSPITISQQAHPLNFKSFIKGVVNPVTNKKTHTLSFSITPSNNFFLPGGGNWAEIYVIAAKVFIPGARTSQHSLSFNLQHSGISTFIKADRKKVVFTHKPVLKGLTYNLTNNQYSTEFDQLRGDYLVNGQSPYVGVSPFSTWTVQIDENVDINSGLDLRSVTEIKILFDFYYRPFNNI